MNENKTFRKFFHAMLSRLCYHQLFLFLYWHRQKYFQMTSNQSLETNQKLKGELYEERAGYRKIFVRRNFFLPCLVLCESEHRQSCSKNILKLKLSKILKNKWIFYMNHSLCNGWRQTMRMNFSWSLKLSILRRCPRRYSFFTIRTSPSMSIYRWWSTRYSGISSWDINKSKWPSKSIASNRRNPRLQYFAIRVHKCFGLRACRL